MATSPKRRFKVFFAAPVELAPERHAFEAAIADLNASIAAAAGVELTPLGWQEAASHFGPRPQSAINREIDGCDVFVLTLWGSWGAPSPGASPHHTDTEAEFHRALARRAIEDGDGKHRPEIVILFKRITPRELTDPGPRLTRVLEFRRELEASHNIPIVQFDDESEFTRSIIRYLLPIITAQPDAAFSTQSGMLFPDPETAIFTTMRQEAEAARLRAESAERQASPGQQQQTAAELLRKARTIEASVILGQSAFIAAFEGRIEAALQDFTKALTGTTHLDLLYYGAEFFKRIGETDEAIRLLQRWLASSGTDSPGFYDSVVYSNLGLLYDSQHRYDLAEQMHQRALALQTSLGYLHDTAATYGNLGATYLMQGDLARAEQMQQMAMSINEKLGRQESLAMQYGNLGFVHKLRGDLDTAELLHTKALAIAESANAQETVANQLAHLGEIARLRDQVDLARELWTRAVATFDELNILPWRDIYSYRLQRLDNPT